MRRSCRHARILIVRLSAIGDVIQTMPVACALRERFPDAFIAWAVQERTGKLLQGHPALDKLIAVPRGWLKSPGMVWRLRRRLRELHFDTTIDVQSLTKSALLARLSGARRRIGFGTPGGRELSRWLNNVRVRSPNNACRRSLYRTPPAAGHRIAKRSVRRARAGGRPPNRR